MLNLDTITAATAKLIALTRMASAAPPATSSPAPIAGPRTMTRLSMEALRALAAARSSSRVTWGMTAATDGW